MDGNTLTKGHTGYEKPIYDFLAQNDAWISLKELGYMFFGEDDWDGIRPFHNTAARRKITQAIHNINASDEFERKTARNPLSLDMGSRAAPEITGSRNSSKES